MNAMSGLLYPLQLSMRMICLKQHSGQAHLRKFFYFATVCEYFVNSTVI